ncbi:MAG TPA: DUF3147 family protein [Candidatus Aquilonibacter sp.]|nr:DUF3147 family protein [Candidatus Aquilonibacter sp.]
MEFVLRSVIGGLVVSFFAVFGDVLKPKSFAGLFGAAPSVALATLTLAAVAKGNLYAAHEARSMVAGAVAMGAYAWATMEAIMRRGWRGTAASSAALLVWFGCALGIWAVFLR